MKKPSLEGGGERQSPLPTDSLQLYAAKANNKIGRRRTHVFRGLSSADQAAVVSHSNLVHCRLLSGKSYKKDDVLNSGWMFFGHAFFSVRSYCIDISIAVVAGLISKLYNGLVAYLACWDGEYYMPVHRHNYQKIHGGEWHRLCMVVQSFGMVGYFVNL